MKMDETDIREWLSVKDSSVLCKENKNTEYNRHAITNGKIMN